jgi:hypothetical protein
MAWQMAHSTPATGAAAFFTFKANCVTAGCSVVSSGDGLAAYSAVGDVITSGNAGANGLNNNNAWFVLSIGNSEFWMVQRGTLSRAWRFAYSKVGFVGGTPNSTTPPTATDQKFFVGTSAPAFVSILTTDATYYLDVGCDTVAPRRMLFESHLVAGSATDLILFRDVLTPAESADQDPYVRGFTTSPTVSSWSTTTQSPSTTGAYFSGYVASATPTTETFFPMEGIARSTTVVTPGNTGSLPLSGKDPLTVVRYGRPADLVSNVGPKGDSTLFAWQGITRSNGITYVVTTPSDRIAWSSMTVPWDGTTPVL